MKLQSLEEIKYSNNNDEYKLQDESLQHNYL